KLAALLVLSLITGNLNGSLGGPAEISSPGSELKDLQSRCSGHFFSTLRPMMDYIAANQDRWKTCEAIIANDTRAEQNQMQIQLASLQESVTNVKAALDSKDVIPQDVVEKLGRIESHLTSLGNQLVTMQLKMDNHLSAIRETQTSQKALEESVTSKDVKLERMEESLKMLNSQVSEERLNRFEEKQSALERQLADILHTLRLSTNFHKINSRYFYFDPNITKSWSDAERFCLEKGGHLAAFKNEAELIAVSAKVNPDVRYWLGVNDRARKGNFVYLATGRKVSYLKWSPGEPDYYNETHCVVFIQGAMRVHNCYNEHRVLCQIGNEI
ncbi:hypothetical protein KR084_011088, partial [Drosophila pseudotakahashii]